MTGITRVNRLDSQAPNTPMHIPAPPHVVRFSVFELDSSSGELRRHGLKVRLPHQSFQILQLLLQRPGEVVTRDELREVLWGQKTFVGFEVGLNNAIRKLREALDDCAERPLFVETLPRRGYRFIAPVSTAEPLSSLEPAGEQPVERVSDAPIQTAAAARSKWRAAVLVLVSVLLIAGVYGRGGLNAPPAVADTIDPQAHDKYLQGVAAMGAERMDGPIKAAAYFEQAIAIQPDFARAYAGLAQVRLQFLFGGPLSPREAIPKAEAAARKALELDDTNWRAHLVLSQILALYYWRWDEADKELQRAAESPQGSPETLSAGVSASLRRRGRFDEAIAATERARNLDPLSLNAQIALGGAYRAAGRYDEALEALRQAHQLSPGHTRVHFQLGVTLVVMGRFDDAVAELVIAAKRPAQAHNPRVEAYLGYAYAAAGRIGDARGVLQELEAHRRDQYVSWFGVALIHDALGEREPALAALQRAHQDHAVEFAQVDEYPPFKTIAGEPAFRAVMRAVGLPR